MFWVISRGSAIDEFFNFLRIVEFLMNFSFNFFNSFNSSYNSSFNFFSFNFSNSFNFFNFFNNFFNFFDFLFDIYLDLVSWFLLFDAIDFDKFISHLI